MAGVGSAARGLCVGTGFKESPGQGLRPGGCLGLLRGGHQYQVVRPGRCQSCYSLGVLFENGREVDKDEARAAALYTKACDGGVALGCFKLGMAFSHGDGVAKDEARATAAYARGCAMGDPTSCAKVPK